MLSTRSLQGLALFMLAAFWPIAIPSAALGQSPTIRSKKITPEALDLSGAVGKPPADRRQRYLDRIGKIREHHRPGPLQLSTKPLATDITQAPSVIRPKPKRVSVSRDVLIDQQSSVTGKAGIDYDTASPISEPTVAVAPYGILVTGNWYAARSLDGSETFEYIDPYRAFGQDPVGSGFCCDQAAIYDPQRELILWFVQGGQAADGSNTVKILAAKGEQAFKTNQWKSFVFASPELFGQRGVFMDFPDIALTAQHLYLTINLFDISSGERFLGSIVMRLPLDNLAGGDDPEVKFFTSGVFSLRLTQGRNLDRMYYAGHGDTGELVVFSWGDADPAPSGEHRVAVERWMPTERGNIASSDGPKGHAWLDRCDSRITGGWATADEIGFTWTAGSDNRFGKPHARVAIIPRAKIDEPGEPLLPITPSAEPHVWSSNVGIAYPSAAPNARGQVGISFAFGGGRNYPSHAIGVLSRSGTPRNWEWLLKVAREGRSGPKRYKDGQWEKASVWGDYYSVRFHPTRPNAWVTIGYTAQNSKDEALKAVAEYFVFSARGDNAISSAPQSGNARDKQADAR